MTGPLEEPAAASWAQGRAVSPSPLGAVRGVVSGWRSRATWRTPALVGSLGARLSRVEGRASALAVALLLAIPIGFNAVTLFPELSIPVANVNDDAFHWLFVQRASEALANGENPFDFWTPQLELGWATFAHYQHLPHLAVVAIHRVLFGLVDLLTLFNLVRYLLLVLLPVTVFWSLRRMGLERPGAALAAAGSTLLSTQFLYGFDNDSYVWRGLGMYTQLWAMHLSFVALAATHTVVANRRGHLLAIVALSLLVLSHLLYAYIMAISLGALFLVYLRRDLWRIQVRDLAVVGAFVLGITAYMWLPFLQLRAFINVSPYLQAEKYDGFGAPRVLTLLVSGELFDSERLPILSLLVGVGIVSAFARRSRIATTAAVLFVMWLVLYFGRPTFGPLYSFLPLSDTLLIHRFIGGVHLAGILLIGLGANWLWELSGRLRPASRSRRLWLPLAAGALTALALVPALFERAAFADQGAQWMRQTASAIATDADARAIVAKVRGLPRGRTFAGLRNDYGPQLNFGIPFKSVRLSDLVVFEGLDVVAPPYNSSSLSSDMLWEFNYQRPEDYDLFNVRYVVLPSSLAPPTFLSPLLRTARYALYAAPTTGYGEYVRASDRRAARSPADLTTQNRPWLLAADRVAQGFIQWDYPASAPHGVVTPSECGRGAAFAEIVQASRLDLVASCEAAGTLLLKVTYDPGWQVTVDGNPVETFMLSPAYIGVTVPAGTHNVSARYMPVSTKTPLLIGGALLLIAAVPLTRRLRSF